ncbi:MAG: hypothetical protein KGM16_15345 [Bacteroidota bacterium]|nr:hypothetical protein [Bacteroidota bacterium]
MGHSVFIAIGFISFIVITAVGISWFASYKQKKEKKKQLQKFNDFVINNHLTIDSKQRFNKNIIGIDRLNYSVVFLNNNTKKIIVIQLKELADCCLIKQRNKTSGHINHIFLQCIFKQKEKDEVILPFYNEMNDDIYMMMLLSKRATYWAKRINLFREAATLKDLQRLSA